MNNIKIIQYFFTFICFTFTSFAAEASNLTYSRYKIEFSGDYKLFSRLTNTVIQDDQYFVSELLDSNEFLGGRIIDGGNVFEDGSFPINLKMKLGNEYVDTDTSIFISTTTGSNVDLGEIQKASYADITQRFYNIDNSFFVKIANDICESYKVYGQLACYRADFDSVNIDFISQANYNFADETSDKRNLPLRNKSFDIYNEIPMWDRNYVEDNNLIGTWHGIVSSDFDRGLSLDIKLDFIYNIKSFRISAVPEPQTWISLLFGFFVCGCASRVKNLKRSSQGSGVTAAEAAVCATTRK